MNLVRFYNSTTITLLQFTPAKSLNIFLLPLFRFYFLPTNFFKTLCCVLCVRVRTQVRPQNLNGGLLFILLGHYSVPRIPDLPGLESFGGMIMHSHDYRTPEPFKNKTVAVLGAAASGSDIAIDICDWARKVYLCHNTPTLPSKFSGE